MVNTPFLAEYQINGMNAFLAFLGSLGQNVGGSRFGDHSYKHAEYTFRTAGLKSTFVAVFYTHSAPLVLGMLGFAHILSNLL